MTCAGGCTTPAGWTAEYAVTPVSFDLALAPYARGEFLGDYQGMTTSGNAFQPFFIATRSTADPTAGFFRSMP